MGKSSLQQLINIASDLHLPLLVLRVPSVTFCSKFKSDAILISCCNDDLLHSTSGFTDPLPAFQLELGKLKSPMRIISGVGDLYPFITLWIFFITILSKDLTRV